MSLPPIKGGGEPWVWPGSAVPVRVDHGEAPRYVPAEDYTPPVTVRELLGRLLAYYTCPLRRHPLRPEPAIRDTRRGTYHRTCSCGRRADTRPVY